MAGKMRPSGGYRKTASFQTTTIIYDGTYWFCEKFLDPRSRTADQMVQAGRSGRQNNAEGSRASATSSQTELRLLNVARASLEELLLDFEDFLRQRHLAQWAPDSPEARAVREVPRKFKKNQADRTDQTDQTDPTDPPDFTDLTDQERWALYAPWLEHPDPAVRANALICLIHQANFLLDQQIAAAEARFIEEGGYSEQLATARLAERERQKRDQTDRTDRTDQTDQSDQTDRTDQSDRQKSIPTCPRCGKAMVLRTARAGKKAGGQFWGCSGYPDCKGAVDL
jgi:four helix bundle suffix protein